MITPNVKARTLADYTASALIIPRLQGSTISAVAEELCSVLQQADPLLPDLRFQSRSAMQRELLTGVDLTCGGVFAHVCAPGVQRPRFSLGRTDQPFQWLAKFYPPTHLVLLVIEPKPSTPEANQLAETLAYLRRQQSFLDELRSSQTAEAILLALERRSLVSLTEVAHQQERVDSYVASALARNPARRR